MSWARAALAAQVLHVAGPELGGLWLRARPCPARDALLAALPPMRRISPGISDEALFGGPDIAATLTAGRLIERTGIVDGAPLCLTGAERASPAFAARMARLIDAGTWIAALDEGDEDILPPPAITARMGLFACLDGIAMADITPIRVPGREVRARLMAMHLPAEALDVLTRTAAGLGISSLRAPLTAAVVARVLAAMNNRVAPDESDLQTAADLSFAHLAMPPEEETEAPPPQDTPERRTEEADTETERLVEATRTALPPGLLAGLAAARLRTASHGTSGAARKGGARGRPLPSRPGTPSAGRIALYDTLRAAAPWQTIRRAARPGDPRPVLIEPRDIHLARAENRTERLVIFCVDASGSAAVARMNEAKGAIETLLAQSYAARDHVALVAFRGTGAEVLLPPTRSLTRVKRRLAGLPGGGGTPLATGLDAARTLAGAAKRQGRAPLIVLLTDGRANITRDGTPDRARATSEAETAARTLRAESVPTLVIDTGLRPSTSLRTLSTLLDARYLALPRTGAPGIAEALTP